MECRTTSWGVGGFDGAMNPKKNVVPPAPTSRPISALSVRLMGLISDEPGGD